MAWQTDAVLQFTRHGLDIVKSSYPARWTPPVPSEARWSAERARRWEEETGWLVGCNFTPSTAGNQLEVFQDETYDPETIDRELGWAADLGMNSIRLFTHHLLHELPYFHDRLDEILGIASSHGIGAVLVPGAAAPKLVTRDMLATMKSGSVLVDVAIDQGGCFETSHPTTHAEPTFLVDGIVHYCVANMPGAVSRTSTYALNNVTLPHALNIADMGWQAALRADPHLAEGLNVHAGQVTYEAVASELGYAYVPVSEALN